MNHKKAIKQYSRSSADQEVPLPHELRPVPVLQMTMCYLMHNILDLIDIPDVSKTKCNIFDTFHYIFLLFSLIFSGFKILTYHNLSFTFTLIPKIFMNFEQYCQSYRV